MAWRIGAKLFREIWPLIERHEPESDFRREFTAELLFLFVRCDVDPADLRALHPELDALLTEIENRPCQDGLGDGPLAP